MRAAASADAERALFHDRPTSWAFRGPNYGICPRPQFIWAAPDLNGTQWARKTPKLLISLGVWYCPVLIGPSIWWSWGDLNPRPQAFVAQIYMFSDLI
jgi:hypothetical protein